MANNRLCPDESSLAYYLSGKMPEKEKDALENHLAECQDCLELLCDAYELSKPGRPRVLYGFIGKFLKYLYPVLAAISLILSFFFHGYFLQLLVAACLFGMKSIMDAKTARTLITVKEALAKDPGKEETGIRRDDIFKK